MKIISAHIPLIIALFISQWIFCPALEVGDTKPPLTKPVLPHIGKHIYSDTPAKRAHHALVYDETEKKILMTAGSTPLDGGRSFAFYNELWHFDGKEWKQAGVAGNKRSGIALAYHSKQKKVFSIGGFTGDSSVSDLRVLENGGWKTLSYLPNMKAAEPGFVYDKKRDRLIVFGGSGGRELVNDITWEWDGYSWKKFGGTGPEGRQAFAMVYDSKRNKSILFGGMGKNPQETYGDTWEYDGTVWSKVSNEGPGARVSPGYAYDSKRGMMIIFGGMSSKGMMADTWGWNGTEWKKLADAGPPARAMGYLAYDGERDRIVLFGGRMGWPNDGNDTWEWNGTIWQKAPVK